MSTITETTTTQHSIVQMASRQIPHGLGLLTTVASLPPKYRSRYLNLKAKSETPLDLTLKPNSPVPTSASNTTMTSRETSSDSNSSSSKRSTPTAEIANDVPMASTFTEVYTETRGDEHEDGVDDEGATNVANAQVFSDTNEVSLVPIKCANGGVYLVQDAATTVLAEADEAIVTITQISKPITPPLTPTKRKHAVMMYEHDDEVDEDEPNAEVLTIVKTTKKAVLPVATAVGVREHAAKYAKTKDVAVGAQQKPPINRTAATTKSKRDCTPTKPIKSTDSAPKTVKAQPPASKLARNKATRKLKFDEETSSPVSGTIIRPLEDITDGNVHYSNGDIDPKYNIVEITEETKAELAAIKNVIGDYICKLCRLKFDDAFGLARHRCACIVLLEYRCPECGKQFNCPANLASHRRWHKPKKGNGDGAPASSATSSARKENRNTSNVGAQAASSKQETNDLPFPCDLCGKRFKRAAYLRKHQQTHQKKQRTTSTSSSTSASGGRSVRSASLAVSAETPTLIADGGLSMASTVVIGGGGGIHAGAYQSYAGSSSSISSSLHSFAGGNANEDEAHLSYAHAAPAANGTYNKAYNGAFNAAYNGVYAADDDDGACHDDDDDDVRSTTSSVISQSGYGRLQIVETGLTEEENIAAAALTNLRNCASVIQHTTLAH